VGDPTLLPQVVPLTPLDRITNDFGEQFTAALAIAPGAKPLLP
jgi:hypothetical protein